MATSWYSSTKDAAPNSVAQSAENAAYYYFKVIGTLPKAISAAELDPNKYYAKWGNGYIEVTDQLIAEDICPADLLGRPCEHDKLRYGCQKVRLCRYLRKYTKYVCRNREQTRVLNPPNKATPEDISVCPHIHDEVGSSCRIIAQRHEEPAIFCRKTLAQRTLKRCHEGHDFELARQRAGDAYAVHRSEARQLGSRGKKKYR